MMELSIPGFKETHLRLHDIILDFNGTLAVDGKLISGVKKRLIHLSRMLAIHVVTGNSFGTAEQELKGIPCKVMLLSPEHQAKEKHDYLMCLNPSSVVSIGNGRNDRLLLKGSAISIAVVQEEGAATETLKYADLVCTSIISALDLITNPTRLTASLRG